MAITLDLEGVYLSLRQKILMSGIKVDIYNIMKDIRRNTWSKLTHQGVILKAFKSHYASIYKNVVKILVERKRDKIWSFFILACLRWWTTPRMSYAIEGFYLTFFLLPYLNSYAQRV